MLGTHNNHDIHHDNRACTANVGSSAKSATSSANNSTTSPTSTSGSPVSGNGKTKNKKNQCSEIEKTAVKPNWNAKRWIRILHHSSKYWTNFIQIQTYQFLFKFYTISTTKFHTGLRSSFRTLRNSNNACWAWLCTRNKNTRPALINRLIDGAINIKYCQLII